MLGGLSRVKSVAFNRASVRIVKEKPPVHDRPVLALVVISQVLQLAAIAIENALLYQKVQRSVQMRDDFIMIASHELKTPVTVIKIQIQMIQRYLATIPADFSRRKDLLANLDTCLRQINNLTGLFENFLDASMISAARGPPPFRRGRKRRPPFLLQIGAR